MAWRTLGGGWPALAGPAAGAPARGDAQQELARGCWGSKQLLPPHAPVCRGRARCPHELPAPHRDVTVSGHRRGRWHRPWCGSTKPRTVKWGSIRLEGVEDVRSPLGRRQSLIIFLSREREHAMCSGRLNDHNGLVGTSGSGTAPAELINPGHAEGDNRGTGARLTLLPDWGREAGTC